MSESRNLPQDSDYQNKGPTILATCSTLTGAATLFVAARLYVRVKILSRISLDDWLIMLSMASDVLGISQMLNC